MLSGSTPMRADGKVGVTQSPEFSVNPRGMVHQGDLSWGKGTRHRYPALTVGDVLSKAGG